MAGRLKLSDTAIRAAKPRKKPFKLSDGRGLHLLVKPNGSYLWRMQYRFAGKQKMIAFGAYDSAGRQGLSLQQARDKTSDAQAMLKQNQDPATKKKLDKIARRVSATNTFDVIADEYLAKLEREGRASRTIEKTKWLIGVARSTLGNRPISEIKPAEVLLVLQGMEKRGKYESAPQSPCNPFPGVSLCRCNGACRD